MPETAQLYAELWVSLASLLRSYTAAHGLNGDRQATIELGEEHITVRQGNAWLDLRRNGAHIIWKRDEGRSGMLEIDRSRATRAAKPARKRWIWQPRRGHGS